MENAAKALLIAGGILLALMTLSLVVYMSTATTRMNEAQEEKKAAEELAAFNMEYEAYNKRRMYGTDIITVVNKAINYNSKVTQASEAITIEITIKDSFYSTEQVIEEFANGTTNKGELTPNGEYSLETKNGNSKKITVDYNTKYDNDVVKFFQKQKAEDSIEILKERKDGYIKKKITYSALANFKRVIFECTECKYSTDGRVNYMKFEQYKTLNDIDM